LIKDETNKAEEENKMKKKSTAVIGMVVCFMMIAAGVVWAGGAPVIPGVPNANGTVTDGGLVWLQNANCFGKQNWNQAMSSARSLKSGSCGLSDGSTAGQWRLPTIDELQNRYRSKQGFNNVQANWYWSSSTNTYNSGAAWGVGMYDGSAEGSSKGNNGYVWPVRAGQ
jgi:hypothetical protein